jgi:formylglycine-generating enzyme required for sulfatase activity
MFSRKQFRGIAVFTLFIFTYFTLTLDYSYSQEENQLLRAQGFYKQGNFIEAVKVLEAFIEKIKGDPNEKKRLAEANLLLARIYYEAGEDARVTEYMKLAVEAYADVGKEEGNLDFKSRLELVREEWLKSQAGKEEIAPVLTKKSEKTETAQPLVQEKEKPAPQIKKKMKFPWLPAILGVGAVAVLVVLLTKKKKQTQKEATYENGVLTVKGVRYELATIPAGEFQMGSNSSQTYANEKPVHNVRISKGFWLGKTEVTQGLWMAVMGSNPSWSKNGDNYPVEFVAWNECQVFIQTLNRMVGGDAFRLPSEAEWEYACRAGSMDDRYGDLDAIAWYESNSGNTIHPVGQKQPNSWGLYDMLGNVFEWCQDWFDEKYYQNSPIIDPSGPSAGANRVLRGGCFGFYAEFIRSAFRFSDDPSTRNINFGFRLARTNE